MSFATPKFQIAPIGPKDVAYLDNLLLDNNGRIKLLPAGDYQQFPHLHLRVWCSLKGRYGLPTVELVQWLKEQIGGRSAIEIGAGNGDLGFHLGIPMTDSYQQVDDPMTVAYFNVYGMAPTRPPADVIKEDAENAVRKRKPKAVIACYVTEKFKPRPGDAFAHGNYKGVRYDYIIERSETFILIGNERVHGSNRALSLPHEKFYFPWLVNRSEYPDLNRIWVWKNKPML